MLDYIKIRYNYDKCVLFLKKIKENDTVIYYLSAPIINLSSILDSSTYKIYVDSYLTTIPFYFVDLYYPGLIQCISYENEYLSNEEIEGCTCHTYLLEHDTLYEILPLVENEEDETTHKCATVVQIDLNVLDIKPESNKKQETKIEITEKLGIVMKYPNFNTIRDYDGQNENDIVFKMTIDCIDYIYDGEQIYYAKDATEEELVEFIESMQSKDLEKIKHFFENMPKISKDVDFKCNKCGYEEKITVEGLESFFV
jgi:hypothetical protein